MDKRKARKYGKVSRGLSIFLRETLVLIAIIAAVVSSVPEVAYARPITDEDFTGSVSIYSSSNTLILTNQSLANLASDSSTNSQSMLEGSMTQNITISGLKVGYTYSGDVWKRVRLRATIPSGSVGSTPQVYFNVNTHIPGISLAFTRVANLGNNEVDYDVRVQFNNWYNDIGSAVYLSWSTTLRQVFYRTDGAAMGLIEYIFSDSSDWAGSAYQRIPSGDYDTTDNLLTDQISQSQTNTANIINNQAELSQNQINNDNANTEKLANGFDKSGFDSSQQALDNNVNSYAEQEEQLIDDSAGKVSAFTDTAMNTNSLIPFVSTIAMVSTWYTQIFNSFGSLNIVLVAGLAMGIAAIIIGLEKR